MKIFCSGIGGIGLSAYAAHMKSQGHEVSGSDKSTSELTRQLESMGISVTDKQDGTGFNEDTDLLVFSEAVPPESPERVKALELNIRQISYFAALGEMTAGKKLIAVCGTHGKSSTTGMAVRACLQEGLDPNVVIGTKLPDLDGKNWRTGNSDIWIVEACEYRRSFHFLQPSIALVTNIDGDHFDAFESMDDYREAFKEFLEKVPDSGVVIIHAEDADTMSVVSSLKKKTINADKEELLQLAVPGLHMQKNAQLVLALSKYLELDPLKAATSLKSYSGSWRRMEVKGETDIGVTVIDDYAHHPTEIRATIQGIRSAYPNRRLVCVFEPHTNDRTLKLWSAFTQAFSEADLVLVTHVYDARPDKDSAKADVSRFASEIGRTSKVSCRPSGNLTKTKETLLTLLKPKDVLLIMGAGNSTKLAAEMIRT